MIDPEQEQPTDGTTESQVSICDKDKWFYIFTALLGSKPPEWNHLEIEIDALSQHTNRVYEWVERHLETWQPHKDKLPHE